MVALVGTIKVISMDVILVDPFFQELGICIKVHPNFLEVGTMVEIVDIAVVVDNVSNKDLCTDVEVNDEVGKTLVVVVIPKTKPVVFKDPILTLGITGI